MGFISGAGKVESVSAGYARAVGQAYLVYLNRRNGNRGLALGGLEFHLLLPSFSAVTVSFFSLIK
jgi:hypothetical protein